MGIYTDQVVPRVINVVLGPKATQKLRRRVCADLSGRVVEIGFGSGLNIPFYPHGLEAVDAVEPADVGWKLSAARRSASSVVIRRSGLDGQRLPFPDASFDCALSTWTLCTIPVPSVALAELRRVLKPGGKFFFVEHGLAPDADVQRWQHRLDPVQQRVAGGCHLTMPILPLIRDAGFTLGKHKEFYDPVGPKTLGAMSAGTAVSP